MQPALGCASYPLRQSRTDICAKERPLTHNCYSKNTKQPMSQREPQAEALKTAVLTLRCVGEHNDAVVGGVGGVGGLGGTAFVVYYSVYGRTE